MKLLLFKATLLITLCTALTNPAQAAYQEEKEKEIDELVKVFSLPFIMKQHVAAEKLAYLGHSDPRIFDLIEKQLLDSYLSLSDEYEIDWASWLAKALGFSIPKTRSRYLFKFLNSCLAINYLFNFLDFEENIILPPFMNYNMKTTLPRVTPKPSLIFL